MTILGNLTQLSDTLQKIERGAKAASEHLEPLAKDIASLPDHLRDAIAAEVFAEVAKHFAPMAKQPASARTPQNGTARRFYVGPDSTGTLILEFLRDNPKAKSGEIYRGVKDRMRSDLKDRKSSVSSTLTYHIRRGSIAYDKTTGEYRLADPKPESQA